MLQRKGQPALTRPPFAVLVAPPRPRIDDLPAVVLIERNVDDLAEVPRALGDCEWISSRIKYRLCLVGHPRRKTL